MTSEVNISGGITGKNQGNVWHKPINSSTEMNDEFLEERIEESNELQVRTTLQISNEWHRGDTFFDGSDKHENR